MCFEVVFKSIKWLEIPKIGVRYSTRRQSCFARYGPKSSARWPKLTLIANSPKVKLKSPF